MVKINRVKEIKKKKKSTIYEIFMKWPVSNKNYNLEIRNIK